MELQTLDHDYLHLLNKMTFDEASEIIMSGISEHGPNFFKNWIKRCDWLPCEDKKSSGTCDHKTEQLIDILYNIFDNAFFCAENNLWNVYNVLAVITQSMFDFAGAKITMQKKVPTERYEIVLSTDPSVRIGFGREL